MEFKKIFVYPRYPENLHRLLDLAYNLRSFWDRETIRLFQRIDAASFQDVRQNPVEFLHNVPKRRLEELSEDDAFLFELEKIWEKYQGYLSRQAVRPALIERGKIAYFCMEFGFYQVPNYAGGLGILSGDHLKGASDLGIPIVGVGLFYRYGYFNQRINVSGYQDEIYRENDVAYLPVREVQRPDGKTAAITLSLGGVHVRIKLWNVQIGHSSLGKTSSFSSLQSSRSSLNSRMTRTASLASSAASWFIMHVLCIQ